MLRALILLIFLTFSLAHAEAQKKELAQAKVSLKTGRDLDQSQKALEKLLKDSVNRRKAKVWTTLFRVMKKKYEDGNEKLYLKQKTDTAALFDITKEMFGLLFAYDSIDAFPNRKGQVRPAYRKRHAEELCGFRANLYNGGTFFVRKANFAHAYDFFDTYLDCASQPLFEGYDFRSGKSGRQLAEAAYWATYCGYKTRNVPKTLKYALLAQTDTSKLPYTLQYIAEAYSQQGDSADYLQTLERGFTAYPLHHYFFPRLIDGLTAQNKLEAAVDVTNRALACDSTNLLFLYAKATLLLNLGRNEECIALSDRMTALNDTLDTPYFNKGTALLNQATELERRDDGRKMKAALRRIYEQARPCFERYRKLAPDQKEKWGIPLYRIYFKLNMGKQFEEIDSLLKK